MQVTATTERRGATVAQQFEQFQAGTEVLVATEPDGLGEQSARVVAQDGESVTVRFFGFGPVPAGRVADMHVSDVRVPKPAATLAHRDGLVVFG